MTRLHKKYFINLSSQQFTQNQGTGKWNSALFVRRGKACPSADHFNKLQQKGRGAQESCLCFSFYTFCTKKHKITVSLIGYLSFPGCTDLDPCPHSAHSYKLNVTLLLSNGPTCNISQNCLPTTSLHQTNAPSMWSRPSAVSSNYHG